MIVYVSSYPRSENSRVRGIITRHFRYSVTEVYGEKIEGNWQPGSKWQLVLASGAPSGWDASLIWNKYTALLYPTQNHGIAAKSLSIRRILLPGCRTLLQDPTARFRLAAEDNRFFIKTHESPFNEYFTGEQTVFVVRHPGPTLLSYYHFLNNLNNLTPNISSERFITKDELIEGSVQYGDWSQFLSAYHAHIPRKLRHVIRYEDFDEDYSETLKKLAEFLGLPHWGHHPIRFTDLQKKNPLMYRLGTNSGYERHFSRAQLLRLWMRHGAMAESYGYTPPDLSQAGDGTDPV